MDRRVTVPSIIVTSLVLVGGASAVAAPSEVSWTPSPVKGFSGVVRADQPKMDGSASGAVSASWFGNLPEPFMTPGNVLVTSYDGASWSCPISLHGTTPPFFGYPPAFDVGADGTVAVAGNEWRRDITDAQAPVDDVVVHVRRPGETAFASAGTGTGFPVNDEAVVATSASRTVAAWISGTQIVGAEFLPGAPSATPIVLATGSDLAFAKLRMDAQGNAVVVYRSGGQSEQDVFQNWLIWPAGQAPGASTVFQVAAPDDFVQPKSLSVSDGGRMIIAMYDGARDGKDNEAVAFVGTTTSGFTTRRVLVSGDPLPATDFATAVGDAGRATVAFRMDDVGGSDAKAWIYSLDANSGETLSSATFTESGETGIGIFNVLQQETKAYVSWTDSNFNALGPGGVISFDGGSITREMTTSQSDWIGLATGPVGPAAYWPHQSLPETWQGTFVSTLPHKPLKAKPTTTKVSVSKRTGAITVKGTVTPAPAARACTGAAVHVRVVNPDPYAPAIAARDIVVGSGGQYSLTLRRSTLKGCKKAEVTTYLQTPDAERPAMVKKTVACSR